MADPKKRSRQRSNGKPAAKQPKKITLYLDESFDCHEVRDRLDLAKLRYKVYSEHFRPGSRDTELLRKAGSKGWVMLTLDRHNRRREAERLVIEQFRVRQFIFTANMGGNQLGELLVKMMPAIRKFCSKTRPPFVAVITATGKIEPRLRKTGP